jgi:hypothetical protein
MSASGLSDYMELDIFSDGERSLLETILDRLDRNSQDSVDTVNSLLVNFASCRVLSDIEGVIASAGLATSLHSVFQSYFVELMKGNRDTIAPDPPFEEVVMPVSSELLRAKLAELFEYFAKVRQHLGNESLNLMAKSAEHLLNSTADALSELFAEMPDKTDEEGLAKVVTTIGKKHKLPNLYRDFQIIILYFDLFPFNYAKFKETYKYKVNDPEINNVEVQRRYLVSLLRKDATFDRRRTMINTICDQYGTIMDKIDAEVKSESERIRELYGATTESLVDFTNQLIDELQ